MFTPELSVRALRTMREKYGDRIYGRYGFVDAFNPNTGWTNPDVIAINQGIILLSAENALTGAIWRWFSLNPEIPRALQRVGLVKYKAIASVLKSEPEQKNEPKRTHHHRPSDLPRQTHDTWP